MFKLEINRNRLDIEINEASHRVFITSEKDWYVSYYIAINKSIKWWLMINKEGISLEGEWFG